MASTTATQPRSFTTSPNDRVCDLLNQARQYGTSETSAWERHITAPKKAIAALAAALIDIPAYPIKGLSTAMIDLIELSPVQATCSLAYGVIDGMRSLFQIASIIPTIVVGILFPRVMYAALPVVKTDQEIQEESKKQALNTQKQLEEIQKNLSTAETTKFLNIKELIQQLEAARQSIESALKVTAEGSSEKSQLKTQLDAITQSIKTAKEIEQKSTIAQTQHQSDLKKLREDLGTAQATANNVPNLQARITELEAQATTAQTQHQAELEKLRANLSTAQDTANNVPNLQARITELEAQAIKVKAEHEEALKNPQNELKKLKDWQSQIITALETVDGKDNEGNNLTSKTAKSIFSVRNELLFIKKIMSTLNVKVGVIPESTILDNFKAQTSSLPHQIIVAVKQILIEVESRINKLKTDKTQAESKLQQEKINLSKMIESLKSENQQLRSQITKLQGTVVGAEQSATETH